MNKILERMEWVEKYLSTFLFLTMLLVLTIQIVSRYFLSFAIPWTEELSRWLYIYIVFIGASEAVSRRDHIAVDIVPNRLGTKTNLMMDVLIHSSFAIISLVIVYRGYIFMERMDRLGSITMDVQMSLLYAAIPLGFTMVFIKSILNSVISLSKLLNPSKSNATANSH
ncbi:TRAP transporter small permease [Vibrio mediterranei]|uniref:TRAP transporter small permease n=1 Tax=Vibrio mediterranei TaxID=689 RepID=UPI00148D77DE|nr:TRAP transporter small permease [Vibrio mediterranei]NOH26828.1 TRAP transporter small permease [Vibrio mediterranei]